MGLFHNDPGRTSTWKWAQHFVTHVARIWPKDQLGDPAVRGETIGLSRQAICKFLLDWKKKYHRDLRRPREMACAAILKTQLYAPTAAVCASWTTSSLRRTCSSTRAPLMPQPKAAPPGAAVHVISHGTQTTDGRMPLPRAGRPTARA